MAATVAAKAAKAAAAATEAVATAAAATTAEAAKVLGLEQRRGDPVELAEHNVGRDGEGNSLSAGLDGKHGDSYFGFVLEPVHQNSALYTGCAAVNAHVRHPRRAQRVFH